MGQEVEATVWIDRSGRVGCVNCIVCAALLTVTRDFV